MLFTSRVIDVCVKLGIPCTLENPINSRLWFAPPINRLGLHSSCLKQNIDQCLFGSLWRKRTAIWSWNCGSVKELGSLCPSTGGICSASGKPHIVLSGTDPDTKKLFTAGAQEYPKLFARAIASLVLCSYHASVDCKLHRFCGVRPS